MAKKEAEDAAAPPKSKKKLIVIAMLALNVVVLGGLGAFVLLGSSSEASAEAPEAAEAEESAASETEGGEDEEGEAPAEVSGGADSALGPTEAVGKFTINLADRATTRYLRVVVSVETSAQKTADEVKLRNPQLRHITIAYLSSLKLSDTQGAGALDKIRRALEQRFNHVLTTGTVRQVYFTDFVTQ